MSGLVGPMTLAPTGSTGNNTHTGATLSPAGRSLSAVLVIEAVGATPTVTVKIQGSLSPGDITDGNAGWFDLPFVTDTNDTVAATLTKTATGSYPMWMSLSQIRFIRRIRAVSSANTNVTYRVDLYQIYTN